MDRSSFMMCQHCLFVSAFLEKSLSPLPGFDLCEVGQEEVILKTGKQANRRTMHFALQSLLALFGKEISAILNNKN